MEVNIMSTTINPAQVGTQAPAFKGLKNVLKGKAENKKRIEEMAKLVEKLGTEVPKEFELAKRSKAEQIETLIRDSALNTNFNNKIAEMLGKTK